DAIRPVALAGKKAFFNLDTLHSDERIMTLPASKCVGANRGRSRQSCLHNRSRRAPVMTSGASLLASLKGSGSDPSRCRVSPPRSPRGLYLRFEMEALDAQTRTTAPEPIVHPVSLLLMACSLSRSKTAFQCRDVNGSYEICRVAAAVRAARSCAAIRHDR